jgi:hypothetical protein
MAIPEDWLIRPVTPAEAEDEFDGDPIADLWIDQWRDFLGRLDPGVELWEYFGAVYERLEPESAGGALEYHGGFALVRGDEVLESIEAPWIG